MKLENRNSEDENWINIANLNNKSYVDWITVFRGVELAMSLWWLGIQRNNWKYEEFFKKNLRG